MSRRLIQAHKDKVVRKKFKTLTSVKTPPSYVITDACNSFFKLIVKPDKREFRPFLVRLASVEDPPLNVIVLCEVMAMCISPSFFNSDLYEKELAKAIENHMAQVNAQDFICSYFLQPTSGEIDNISITEVNHLELISDFAIITQIRNEDWKHGSLYSIGSLFISRKKNFMVQSVLSRLKKLDMMGKVDATDLSHYTTYYTSDKRNEINVNLVSEIVSDKFDVVNVTASGSTIGAVNRSGQLLLHGERSMIGPVCLGTITAPKEWRGASLIDNILGHKITQVIAGLHHFCAVTTTNQLITWGFNVDLFANDKKASGQLGHMNGIFSPPALIDSVHFEDGAVITAACGASHTIVLASTGLYTFGSNTYQQLGRPGVFGSEDHHCIEKVPSFLFRYLGQSCVITQIAAGSHHCVAISYEGLAWMWGNNVLGQCGVSKLGVVELPRMIEPPDEDTCYIQAACGHSHTLLLTNTGTIYALGSNLFGQLGINDDTSYVSVPRQVEFPNTRSPVIIVNIACGTHSSSCVTTEGLLYRWGILRSLDKMENQYVPIRVESCYQQHMYITSSAEGCEHVIVKSEDKISRALAVFTQFCRFEYQAKYEELFEALKAVPSFLLGPLQQRASRWLHEMYEIRPYLLIDRPDITFDIVDSRNLADTILTLRKRKAVQGEYTDSLSQEIEIANPLSRPVQVDLFIQKYERTYGEKEFELAYSPSQFVIGKNQKKTVEIILRYSHKEPPSPQKIILAITATRQSKKNIAPNPSGTCRHFAYIQMRTIQRTRVNHQMSNDEPEPLSDHLTPYLPYILLSRFHKDPTPPEEPFVESFPAAILFVDISGFTSLNEKLAELGPAGPERVSHHINSYFTSLIKAVNDHGGDTLKFAGDALICMFGSPTTEESLEILTRRATQCALTIQTCLAKYDSNQGFTLTLHVGIGAGTIYALYLGGVQSSWEFLVTGEPLAQLRTCVDLSSAGEVVVSSPVWDLISSHFEGELIEDSENHDYLIRHIKGDEIPPQSLPKLYPAGKQFEKTARCFIPQAVQVQIDSNQTKWMDELRLVTVLFVKLNSEIPSSSMDQFCQSLQHYLVIMQTEIFRFDGMVRQFLADDKGTVLIAAFGLPPSSHMDGGIRAIRAAIAIHENLKNVNMSNSIGITTGAVFCGAVGSVDRREYAMVGDIVNLSARLMVAACKMGEKFDRQILCDKATFESCKGKQDLMPLEPIYVKGKAKPIDIYNPTSRQKSINRRGRWRKTNSVPVSTKFHLRTCVGRDHELKVIMNQLQVIQSKEESTLLVLVEGESGFGKSRISNLCHFKALRNGFHCFLSSGDSIATSQPFSVWRNIVTSVITSSALVREFSEMSRGDQMYCIAERLCGPQHEDYLSLLQQIIPALEVPQPTPSFLQQLNANQKQLRLTQLITQLIISRAKETIPLFIIIDDLQWSDLASLHLLSHLLANVNRVFFLCSMRPLLEKNSKTHMEIQKLSQNSLTTVIKLLPFEENQVILLVKEILSVNLVPDELLELLKAAQGSPMYLTEIIYHLVSTNAICVKDEAVILQKDLADIHLPDTLQEIVAGRFDNLSQTIQMLLKVASVIGIEFPIELLHRIYSKAIESNVPAHVMIQDVELACDKEFIHVDPRNPRVYIFNNAYFQQVAYSRLLFSQRTQLHRDVAKHYEVLVSAKTDCEEVGLLYPSLHHHWNCILAASIADKNVDQEALGKTIYYLKLVGEYSAQLGNEDAVSYFKEALEKTNLITDKAERIRRQKELKLKIIGTAQKTLMANTLQDFANRKVAAKQESL